MSAPDARQRIADATRNIRNRQDRAVARFNLWADQPEATRKDKDHG